MGKNSSELNEENFDDFISKGIAVVDFWADWCGPCKIMGPIFEEAAGSLKGKVKFGKVDVDANSELSQRFEVMSIPTMIFFRNGEPADRVVGVIEKEDLLKRIEEIQQ